MAAPIFRIPPTWVCVATARSAVEVMLYRGRLEAAKIPFHTKNELVQGLIGTGSFGAFNIATGPVEFWVPAALRAQALQWLNPAAHSEREPLATCPACETPNPHRMANCTECGLFLG